MERGQTYGLSSAILTSIYRGLGQICCSTHMRRKGGHIPWHSLCAWVAKYFRTYDFDDNVSSNLRMPKFNALTLIDNGQLSRADFAYFANIHLSYACCNCKDSFVMEHYCPHRFSRQFGFHQDVPADIDFSILPCSKIMLRFHQACVRYGTNS
ncbi:hypothetical protein Cgig2_010635 [Carnegiea gigantea]|uniref:Uncharacterized protein n=1 Tax=Carnegiea gigantea TaxID=171969 RepID=A0A9Q1JLI5_9CARY|nr:hypothetical protein Cgig2_010635 [Carnegiea gigantea]